MVYYQGIRFTELKLRFELDWQIILPYFDLGVKANTLSVKDLKTVTYCSSPSCWADDGIQWINLYPLDHGIIDWIPYYTYALDSDWMVIYLACEQALLFGQDLFHSPN